VSWSPKNWPIAARITGSLVLLAVAATVTVQATGLWRGRRAFREIAARPLVELAETTAEALDALIRQEHTSLAVLADDPAVRALCAGGPAAAARPRLDARREHDADVELLMVVGKDGRVLASAHGEVPPGTDVRARPYFAPALAGTAYTSGMRAGALGSGVYLSRPVVDGGTAGVLVLRIPDDRIQEIVESKDVGAGGAVMLGEPVGARHFVFIAHSDPASAYTTGRPLTEEQAAAAQRRWRRAIRVAPVDALEARGDTFEARQAGQDWVGGAARCETVPWTVFTVLKRGEFESDFTALALQQAGTLVAVLAFAALLALAQSRAILRPVRTLSATADRIAGGDLDARANIGTDDELGRLARAFDRMVPQLTERLKLKESLAVAGEVQRELLPQAPPEFPGLDVYGANEPYEQVGGDYFDFLDLRATGDPRLAVVVGDVVGHGIAAALLMATARAHVRSRARPMPGLGRLFDELNERLSADLTEEQFMTLAVYAFDPGAKRVDWTSAGQDAAFHYRVETGAIEERRVKNVPLGIMDDWEYGADSRDDLREGDVLLIGTDGIWETRNASGEEFGKERLRRILAKRHAEPSRAIVETVLAEVRRFRGDLPNQDDVTLVCVRIGQLPG